MSDGARRCSAPVVAGRLAPVVVAAAAGLLLAGCGSVGSATGARAGSTLASARIVGRPVGVAVVRTARENVWGVNETVLTDGAGRTLYWFTDDRPTRIACTVGCTQAWFPLLTRGTRIDIRARVPLGRFTVFDGPNGRQVEYGGHPLYTTDQDTGPRQSNGQGFEDAWYVATPRLGAPAATGGGW